jgi:hypothetical protein
MTQESLELRRGRIIDQKWSQCLGRLVRYHPVTIAVAWSQRVVFRLLEVMLTSRLLEEELVKRKERLLKLNAPAWERLNGFSLNLAVRIFSKICYTFHVWLKCDSNAGDFTWRRISFLLAEVTECGVSRLPCLGYRGYYGNFGKCESSCFYETLRILTIRWHVIIWFKLLYSFQYDSVPGYSAV